MRKFALALAALLCFLPAMAQNPLNDNPDSIVGEYLIHDKSGDSKVRFTRNSSGTYDCQVFWVKNAIDPETGQPWLDYRTPDKSLRSRRTDSIVIILGLKYNADKKQWDGAKIYDPVRGIKANVTCMFLPDGRFQLKGTVLGIGEKSIWKKLN